jgi:hypothetical protein
LFEGEEESEIGSAGWACSGVGASGVEEVEVALVGEESVELGLEELAWRRDHGEVLSGWGERVRRSRRWLRARKRRVLTVPGVTEVAAATSETERPSR